jgi:hypothetical protein
MTIMPKQMANTSDSVVAQWETFDKHEGAHRRTRHEGEQPVTEKRE